MYGLILVNDLQTLPPSRVAKVTFLIFQIFYSKTQKDFGVTFLIFSEPYPGDHKCLNRMNQRLSSTRHDCLPFKENSSSFVRVIQTLLSVITVERRYLDRRT